MAYAIISDIHGNLPALDAVLDDIAQLSVKDVICLGDVAAFGPFPREAIARVKEAASVTIMGNTDDWLLDPKPHAVRDENSAKVTAIEMWAAEQLTPDDRSFLASFRSTSQIALGPDLNMLCCHGSPSSYTDILRAETPDDEVEKLLEGFQAQFMVGGHTHVPMLRRFRDKMLINPGSVGLPWVGDSHSAEVRNPPWAEYAYLKCADGQVEITFKRVPYEVEELIQAAFRREMPFADWWAKDWTRS